jgi:ABC-2 type transport system permease protein
MITARFTALLRKELLDLSRNRGALLPVAIVAMAALLLPFGVALVIPAMTGHRLGDDSDLVKVSAVVGAHEALTREGRVQLFLFQQFLMLFLLAPITGAMALAAHSVVGEKQARTLEPLLATPIGTVELLVAKVLGSLIPPLGIAVAGLVLYFAGLACFAEPGVVRGMITPRTSLLVLLVAPASALLALQAAIIVSSRVNDPRTAQQFGVLIIIPFTVVLVAQFAGMVWLSARAFALVGAGMFALWGVLTVVSAALFERDRILTNWR